MAVPETVRSTLWFRSTGLRVVAVTVIRVVPTSVPVVVLTERLTGWT